jgi:hypothetical protein
MHRRERHDGIHVVRPPPDDGIARDAGRPSDAEPQHDVEARAERAPRVADARHDEHVGERRLAGSVGPCHAERLPTHLHADEGPLAVLAEVAIDQGAGREGHPRGEPTKVTSCKAHLTRPGRPRSPYASPSPSWLSTSASSRSSVGSRARARGGVPVGKRRWARMRRADSRSVTTARTRSRPRHFGTAARPRRTSGAAESPSPRAASSCGAVRSAADPGGAPTERWAKAR